MPKKKRAGSAARKAAWEKVRFKKGMLPWAENLLKRKGMIVEEINSSKDPAKAYLKYAEAGTLKALFSPQERKSLAQALMGREKARRAKPRAKSAELELEGPLRKTG